MLNDTPTSKVQRLLLFGILPLFYIWLSLSFQHRVQAFYLRNTDPIYAYLINGTNLASGNIESGLYQHPGMPMQYFIGVVVFIKHLFTGQGPVYQDVILHPESYLHVICITLTLLLALVTFFTGTYVFRHTGKLGLSLFFQFTPLFNDECFFNGALPVSESFIIITSTFFIAYIYMSLLNPARADNSQDTGFKKYILFGLFSALLISSKITCTPLVIPILFMAETYKQRLVYLISIVVFFLVFIIPILSQLNEIFAWIKDLFIHEGHYGGGKADILNPQEFKHFLAESLTTDIVFTFTYAITTLALFTSLFILLKKRPRKALYTRGIIGVWLAFTIFILMVSKHYLFVYFIPIQCFFGLALILSYNILIPSGGTEKSVRIKNRILYTFSFILIALCGYTSVHHINYEGGYQESVENIEKFIAGRKDKAVITTTVYGSPYVQSSLLFGIVYSSDMRSRYFQFARNTYPDSYFYTPETKSFANWDIATIPPELFKQFTKVLVYFRNSSPTAETAAMDDLCNWDGKKIVNYEHIYEDASTHENLYEITSDTAAIHSMFTKTMSISCDMEKLTPDKSEFLTDNEKYKLTSANLVSTEEHHSGIHSVKLGKQDTYTLNMDLDVTPGDFVTLSIWEKSVNSKAAIVLTSKDASIYACGSAITTSDKNGWVQVVCKFRVPNDFKEKTAKFFMFYLGKNDCWLDDLEINTYRVK